MILYGELTKIEPQDDGSIKVYGRASTGGRDGAGEIVSPDAMRKALPDYMAYPAIREMHQPLAAGAALYAEVDEDGATRICAHVVDPLAVKKVKAGVYKGLSIGGRVLARDPADASLITAIRLDEISLVDRPCNPEAVIDLWKAQAPSAPTPARAPTPTNDEVRAEAEAMAKAASRPGRRNDYVAAAREKLTRSPASATPLIPTKAGTQIVERDAERRSPVIPEAEPHLAEPNDLAPGLRRDERSGGSQIAPFAEVEHLHKLQGELAAARAEIERLKRAPLPPRTAASGLAKAVGKTEDGEGPLSPDAFAEALAALPASERAHLIMKAALARPIAL